MADEKHEVDSKRRNFIRSSTLAGAGAIVAGSLPGVATAETQDSQTEEKKEKGYRLTKHIQDYYKSAAS